MTVKAIERTPIRLTEDEKEFLLDQAMALNEERAYSNMTTLLKAAIARMPEDRRPTLNSTTEPRWAWFLTGINRKIKEAARLAALPPPPPKAEPEEEIAPPEIPAQFVQPENRVNGYHPQRPLTLAETQANREFQESFLDSQDYSDDEREEWAMIVKFRRERQQARMVDLQLDQMRKATLALTAAIQALRGEIAAMPEAMREATSNLVRAANNLNHQNHAAMSRVEIPGKPVVSLPPKPKVVIIGYGSGHQRGGVEKEVAGRAILTFAPAVVNTFPKYDQFDYIVVPKDCPKHWQEQAREKYPRNKIIFASGNSEAVGQMIAKLQPPRVMA